MFSGETETNTSFQGPGIYIYIYLHLPTVQNFCLFMHKTQPKGRNSAQLEDLGINSFGVPFDLCSFPLNNLLMSRMSFVHVFDYN